MALAKGALPEEYLSHLTSNAREDTRPIWCPSYDQRTDQTAFFLAPIITDFIRNTKR